MRQLQTRKGMLPVHKLNRGDAQTIDIRLRKKAWARRLKETEERNDKAGDF